jgi:hypothetical protein
MKYTISLFVIIFSSCGSANGFVDEKLQPYFNKFEQDIGIAPVGVVAFFDDVKLPALATCTTSPFHLPEIRVDYIWWEGASEDSREQLIYHELGHCVLDLGHNPNLNEYGCPESIMYPYVFGKTSCYKHYKPYYYEELIK